MNQIIHELYYLTLQLRQNIVPAQTEIYFINSKPIDLVPFESRIYNKQIKNAILNNQKKRWKSGHLFVSFILIMIDQMR